MNFLRITLLIGFSILINACSGSGIESVLAPDPELETQTNNNDTNRSNTGNQNNNQPSEPQLPEDFPRDIPIYQSATIVSIVENKITWQSDDPINLIINYYQ